MKQIKKLLSFNSPPRPNYDMHFWFRPRGRVIIVRTAESILLSIVLDRYV